MCALAAGVRSDLLDQLMGIVMYLARTACLYHSGNFLPVLTIFFDCLNEGKLLTLVPVVITVF